MDLPRTKDVKRDSPPDPGDDSEQKLLKMLDAIADEAQRVKDHWVKDVDLTRDLDLYRGKLKGNADDRYFDCNFVGAFIDRMVAQLTDNRPIIRLENRKAGISKVARSVEKVIQCVWDESKVQRGLFKLANNAAVNRSAGLYTGFDTETDTPVVELLRIAQVLVDPNVVESGQLDSAEYVRIERVMPLAEIRLKFPGRGSLVKSDVNISHIGQEPKRRASMFDGLRSGTMTRDTIPRARVYEWFIQDRATSDTGDRLFPSYRRIICSDDVVLWDGPNPFWDGRIPVDWFDWMVDPEHIWGHCLVGETRISTERGIVPLTEAMHCKTTESGLILDFIPQGVKPVYRLTTRHGYQITGTGHHRVHQANGGWVELSRAAGSTIALVPPRFADDTYVAEWSDVPCATTRLVIDESWGRFLGYFMGDGSYHGSGHANAAVSTSALEIACFDGDQDVIADVQQLLQSKFGKETTVRLAATHGVRVRLRGQALFGPLRGCDVVRKTDHLSNHRWSRYVHVPEVIWRSPKSVVREFLRGLFESDGSVDLRGRVSLASKKTAFLRDVQLLLLGFGITCHLRPAGRYAGKLELTVLESAAFYTEIGFIGIRKQERNKKALVTRTASCHPIVFADVAQTVEMAGEAAVFDLTLPAPHLFSANGIGVHNSEPARLRKMQLAFNQLIDGLIENQLLTNIISIVGDADSLPPEMWKKLQNIKSSLLLQKKNRNSTLNVTPPQPFGQDKIQIARSIFTYAQLLTGVTDVTLGDAPGSLQSGLAIEGLQEGANLMTRARASRLEDLMNRVGQKLISRVFQFVTSDRVFTMVGPTAEAVAYAMARSELFINDKGQPMTQADQRDALRFMRFSVIPGSSAPGSRLARARMMAELVKLGAASRRDVLQAADFQDPDDMLKRAQEDAGQNPVFQAMAKKEGKPE